MNSGLPLSQDRPCRPDPSRPSGLGGEGGRSLPQSPVGIACAGVESHQPILNGRPMPAHAGPRRPSALPVLAADAGGTAMAGMRGLPVALAVADHQVQHRAPAQLRGGHWGQRLDCQWQALAEGGRGCVAISRRHRGRTMAARTMRQKSPVRRRSKSRAAAMQRSSIGPAGS